MEPKWTKGPYTAGMPSGHNASNIYAANGKDAIASVYGIPIHTSVDEVEERYAEGMATARLLAASTQMYDALLAIYRGIHPMIGGPTMRREEICNIIEAALRAARGES